MGRWNTKLTPQKIEPNPQKIAKLLLLRQDAVAKPDAPKIFKSPSFQYLLPELAPDIPGKD
jgi:hypothetical protein